MGKCLCFDVEQPTKKGKMCADVVLLLLCYFKSGCEGRTNNGAIVVEKRGKRAIAKRLGNRLKNGTSMRSDTFWI